MKQLLLIKTSAPYLERLVKSLEQSADQELKLKRWAIQALRWCNCQDPPSICSEMCPMLCGLHHSACADQKPHWMYTILHWTDSAVDRPHSSHMVPDVDSGWEMRAGKSIARFSRPWWRTLPGLLI